MSKIKKTTEEWVAKPERTWTDEEMRAMDSEVKAFFLEDKRNWNKWYEKKGVAKIRIVEHTAWPSGEKTGETSEQLVILKDELNQIPFIAEQEKVNFYLKWKGKKEFGEQKKVEHFEHLAEQMKVPIDGYEVGGTMSTGFS